MQLLRDLGEVTPDRYPYLAGLGFDPEDAGRLAVAAASASQGGFYVEAASGDRRLLDEGDPIPAGVWLAQEEIDGLKPTLGADLGPDHGFGEGWGKQGAQLGGDVSSPEEDAGGTRRAANEEAPGSGTDPVGIEPRR